jgi:hypothetical protein
VTNHWTVQIKIIECIDEPAVEGQYKTNVPARKFDREDASFTVRKDTRRQAIVAAIGHLHFENPDTTGSVND